MFKPSTAVYALVAVGSLALASFQPADAVVAAAGTTSGNVDPAKRAGSHSSPQGALPTRIASGLSRQ